MKSIWKLLNEPCKLKFSPIDLILGGALSWFLIFCVTGCKLFGSNAAPPTAFDQHLFDITTNWVQKVSTNIVTQTQTVIVPIVQTQTVMQTITVTNTTGMVIPQVHTTFDYHTVNQTNTFLTTNTVLQTSTVPQYAYVPNSTATNVAGVAGTLSNLGMPGIGSLVSMGIIGALGIYGKLRGNKVAGALTQGIETAREVIQTTPQGQALDASFKAWLINHQATTGVLSTVANLASNVDNSAAQSAAQAIKADLPVITAVTVAPPPSATVTPTITTAPKV